jgi:hypothetical protein
MKGNRLINFALAAVTLAAVTLLWESRMHSSQRPFRPHLWKLPIGEKGVCLNSK